MEYINEIILFCKSIIKGCTMTSIGTLVKIRYSKPLEALKVDALEKGILATVAVIYTSSTNVITTLRSMFDTPVELVLLLLFAIILDWVTGIKCAKSNGNYIRSLGLRQTWVKSLEYAAGLFILTGIANVFGAAEIQGWVGDLLRYLKNIHWLGYFYATFTEFKSIAENVQGKEGRFSEIIDKINDKFFGDKGDKVR